MESRERIASQQLQICQVSENMVCLRVLELIKPRPPQVCLLDNQMLYPQEFPPFAISKPHIGHQPWQRARHRHKRSTVGGITHGH